MSEEKIMCDCGCGQEKQINEALQQIWKILGNHAEGLKTLDCVVKDIYENQEESESKTNLNTVIETLCADIKSINERLDRLEGKDNPSVRVCYSNDVKPV